MKRMPTLLKLLRVKHYIKNLLIFAPVFFAGIIFSVQTIKVLLGGIALCFICSFVYIINDIKDIDKDRKHPTKCHRPIASGDISVRMAGIIAASLFICAFIILLYINAPLLAYGLLAIYIVMNIGYSFGLKDIPIVDVSILAAGFLIRLVYGGIFGDVWVSSWLYMTVFAIAFYLGLGKRRNELLKINTTNIRKVNERYSVEFLDKNMYMCLTIGIVFYSLWALERSDKLVLSIPIVFIICLLYNFILESDSDGDPVPVLLSSWKLIMLAIIYILAVFFILYF